MYQPSLAPVSGSLAWSALFAAAPILVLFVLLGGVRARAWLAALSGLATALLVAVLGYGMPAAAAVSAASEGAAFGLFPLVWTFTTAIWIHTMTVESGHFDVLRRAFARVSSDQRIQALMIAFCFGSLLEALAGQGTPIAITSVMLLAAGFSPMRAAVIALVANTVPAAFGPLGLPITTLAKVSDLPAAELGAMAGRQVPILAVFIPLLLIGIVDGRRGLRETWRAALVCGLAFGLAQFVTSNYLSVPLADIAAAVAGAGALGLHARMRSSSTPVPRVAVAVTGTTEEPPSTRRQPLPTAVDTRAEVWRAFGPYLTIVAIFVGSQLRVVKDALESVTVTTQWPGLHLLTAAGKPSTLPVFQFNWLASTGTLLLLSGAVTMVILRVRPRSAAAAYLRTIRNLRWAILTVTAVLALSFVMNASGQTATLGTWMASAGVVFAALAPVLGWLGVAVTGSDTSSNSLFGALQVTAAQQVGIEPSLLAAANASGGVAGKMISLQNLTIAANTVGLKGAEGDLFRRVAGWSAALVLVMSAIVALQASPVLSWMVP